MATSVAIRSHNTGPLYPGTERFSKPSTSQACFAIVREMPTLAEKLLLPDVRPKVVLDSTRLIDEEVRDKSGLSGLAIKAAYAVVKAVKPGIIPEVLDAMLDAFIARLEPLYAEWQKNPSVPFSSFLDPRAGQTADALLSITDERARVSKNQTLKKAYERLRPSGKKQVESAVPRLGRMISKYL